MPDRPVTWLRRQWAILRAATRVQWVMFVTGTALLSAGIGAGILPSTLGAGPADAMFAGAADLTPLTVGTWVLVGSVGLIVLAWRLGTPILLGTIVMTLLFSTLVDLALLLAPHYTTLPWQVGQWLVGAVTLAVGAGLTVASGVGASAYDMATVAIASKLRGHLWAGRLVLDGTALVIALIIGGPLAWGTLGLMVVFPVVMPTVVRYARRFAPTAPVKS